jgi:hypothetical protein
VATIKAQCPRCGTVRLRPHQVTVRVCADDGSAAYRFSCPRCAVRVSHATSQPVVDLLVQAGVHRESWRLPAELGEARHGPPLTADDLLDFHLLLNAADWPAKLAALAPRTDTTS